MKKIKYFLFAAILAIALVIVNLSFTLAKYVANITWDYYLESKSFYFESDILNDKTTEDTSWNGEDIYFNIKNYSGSNISNYQIDYSLSCQTDDPKVTCEFENNLAELDGSLFYSEKCFNDIDAVDVDLYKKAQCTQEGYTWRAEKTNKDVYIKLISENDYKFDIVTVEVEADSLLPYSKKLKETFIIHNSLKEEEPMNVNVLTSNDLLYLNLTNNQDNRCINLSFNESDLNIINDNYEILSSQNNYINSIKLDINNKETKEIVFYIKNKSINYTSSNFTINDCN